MTANVTVVPTETEKKSSYKHIYVKKRAAQLTIKCRIEKFKTLMDSTEPGEGGLWSEAVTSDLAPRAVWRLSVYPNSVREEQRGSMVVMICFTGPMSHPLKEETRETLDTYHLYLVDGSGKVDWIVRETRTICLRGDVRKISHDRVKKALHADGSLVVVADLSFIAPDYSALHVDVQQWPTKFSQLYGDEAFSDCSIEIGAASIPAHKCILAANSPIFQTMFTNPGAEESKSGMVTITDFQRPEPMRALLRYCYQGCLDAETMDGDGAMEIFQLADKYLIDDLKAHLEEHFIRKRLRVGNVIEMVELADMHSAVNLKEACIDLIVKEWDAVSESAEWERLEEEMPELAAELAEARRRRR